MGQKIGKATFVAEAGPFLNADKASMAALWSNYQSIAEGMGLTPEEFRLIVDIPTLGASQEEADRLFQVLDADNNGLVDALEFLAFVALSSGLDREETIEYTFRLFDFDESEALTMDEMTLSLKSSLTGLAKVTGEAPPSDATLEEVSRIAFQQTDKDADRRISLREYLDFCRVNPEARSYLDYFDDPDEASAIMADAIAAAGRGNGQQGADEYDSDLEEEDMAAEAASAKAAAELALRDPEDPASAALRVALYEQAEAAGGAEGIMARRAWATTAQATVPSVAPPADSTLPDCSLRLQWVHGYRCHDARNNLAYNAAGDIVYSAAGVGIALDPESRSQRFNIDHADDIVSLAVHPSGRFVATGEMGRQPRIVVWDSMQGSAGDHDPEDAAAAAGTDVASAMAGRTQALQERSMDGHAVLRGFHSRAVAQMAFSPSGRLLASIGRDDYNSVAIYDWEAGKTVRSDKGTTRRVYGCVFRDERTLVTCGKDHVFFWDLRNGSKRKGLFGSAKGVKIQTLLSVAVVGGNQAARWTERADAARVGPPLVATGALSGHIYLWRDRNCIKAVRAHERSTAALHGAPGGLASGGKDGRVKLWNNRLECLRTIDVSAYGAVMPAIRAVCWDADPGGARVLVGTKGSEIFELSAEDGRNLHDGPLVQGHCQHEVWGLAAHPERPEYCTVGDDGTLRIWDADARAVVRMTRLGAPARAVAYSPEGDFLAVGIGADAAGMRAARGHRGGRKGPSAGEDNGAFLVLRSDDLAVIFKGKDASEYISDVKFTPNGQYLLVGSHDNNVYIYQTTDFALHAVCTKHSSYITHIDVSVDSSLLQCTSGAHELLYFNVADGKQQVSAAAVRDVEWQTWTSTLGWAVQGMWPSNADGTDINACARAAGGGALVSADDFGCVKLHRFPSLTPDAADTKFLGHSSHVTNVRWTAGDRHVVSTGGLDRCVFQWQVVGTTGSGIVPSRGASDVADDGIAQGLFDDDGEEEDADEAEVELDEEDEEDLRGAKELDMGDAHDAARDEDRGMSEALREAAAGGNREAKAPQRPWMAAVVGPSGLTDSDASIPDVDARLEWVHGYRAQDSRNNLKYLEGGRIAFPAAALGVVMDPSKMHQTYFRGHTDDVMCLDVHPDGVHVATGQLGKRPKVVVWNTTTMEAVSVFDGVCHRAVTSVAFSKGDGRYLAAVGEDDDHTVSFLDWRNRVVKWTENGGKNKALDVAVSTSGTAVCLVGDKFIRFMTYQGRNAKSSRGLVSRRGKIQPFLCVDFAGESAMVGSHDGHVYVFEGRKLRRAVKTHDGACTAISVTPQGVATGGKDGVVRLWTVGMERLHEFDLAGEELALNPVNKSIRAVCWDADHGKVLVGTRGSEIFELSAEDGRNLHDGPLVQGHCQHEVWGLAAHPERPEYCTVGDDGTLRIWDADSLRQKALVKLGTMARAVAYSPDGSMLAIGLGGRVGGVRSRQRTRDDGKFLVISAADFRALHSAHDSREYISDIKFSPDGQTLGVASHDNRVYLYDAREGFALRGVFDRHSSYITHFDFSADSRRIQSNCGSYEHLFADAETGAHIPSAAAVRDVEWSTWTCTLGWPVQGIWPSFADGTDINACSRSHSEKTIASADDFGRVRLQRYPCLSDSAGAKQLFGHASHVTNVGWTAGDRHLVSTGGLDRCVFQWRIDSDEEAATVLAGGAMDGGEEHAAEVEEPLVVKDLERYVRNGRQEEPAAAAAGAGAGAPVDGALDTRMAGPDSAGQGMGEVLSSEPPQLRRVANSAIPPSRAPSVDPSPPDAYLELDWVHGYRARDARNNLHYNSVGHMVYHAAGVGIVYDPSAHTQRHYLGHDDDIVSLALDPQRRIVATGQLGRRPRVHVWDAASATQLCVLPLVHSRGVPVIAFSPDSCQVLAVGDDDNHTVGVFKSLSGNWSDGRVAATSNGDKGKVMFASFLPAGYEGGFTFVTGGVNHIRFWTMEGRALTSKRGLVTSHRRATVQTILSAAIVGGKLVTGTVSGHLYGWKGRQVDRVVSAYDPATTQRSIYSLRAHANGVIAGCRDGKVRMFSNALDPVREVDFGGLEAPLAPVDPTLRSVDMSADSETVLCGTAGSEVYEVSLVSGRVALRAQGHCAHELWGLSTHPRVPFVCATGGDDGTVRVWDMRTKRILGRTEVPGMCRAVDWSPDGSLLAVGIGGRTAASAAADGGRDRNDGTFVLLRTDTLATVHAARDTRAAITDVRFAPNGTSLALGAKDGKVYVYDTRAGRVSLMFILEGHSSNITHLDYSLDGSLIRSSCGAHELLYHDARSGRQVVEPEEYRDTEWASHRVPLGWAAQGIWPPNSDCTDVNGLDRTRDKQLLATADDFGGVNLLRFPAGPSGDPCRMRRFAAHSAHVTNVRFSADDSLLVSTGGLDRALIQWKVMRL